MPMTGETLVVAVIVGAAAFFTLRRGWRAVRSARASALKSSAGCDAGCGCEPGGAPRARDWAEP